MLLLILNLIPTVLLVMRLLNARASDASRGTNVVTRFVRDVGANSAYTRITIGAFIVTAGTLLLGLLFKCPWACIPSAILIFVPFIFRFQSNANKQRVQDARVVTKGTVGVAAEAAPAAVAIGLTATGVGAGAGAAIYAATKAGSRVAKKAADQMDDVNTIEVDANDFRELNAVASRTQFGGPVISAKSYEDEAFIESCESYGISTKGRDVDAIAEEVISYAPKVLLEQLPDDLSLRDKAYSIIAKSKQMEVISDES